MEQPNNLEAEEALLACCLLDNVAYDSISTIVNADDFYRSVRGPTRKQVDLAT